MRADDLAAHPVKALMARNEGAYWDALDEVILGATNQAGEDNRNLARMVVLLAGLPVTVAGHTVNRLCASDMDAVIAGARAIQTGAADFIIAGGSESMSRAPMVMPKADAAFSRRAEIYDTTIDWRFPNKAIEQAFGNEAMPETAENVAADWGITREDQDRFALSSQQRAADAQTSGRLSREISPVTLAVKRGDPVVVECDEHPRLTALEKLASLKTPFRDAGTVTAGNASGVNDGAAALILASAAAVKQHGLSPLARFDGAVSAGVAPRVMGIGPVPATQKLCARLGIAPVDFDLIELNEAFAAQAIAVCRDLNLDPMAKHINPNGGAIALGHPLGMTGARLVGTAALDLANSGVSRALCSMCVGVGQGVSVALSRV